MHVVHRVLAALVYVSALRAWHDTCVNARISADAFSHLGQHWLVVRVPGCVPALLAHSRSRPRDGRNGTWSKLCALKEWYVKQTVHVKAKLNYSCCIYARKTSEIHDIDSLSKLSFVCLNCLEERCPLFNEHAPEWLINDLWMIAWWFVSMIFSCVSCVLLLNRLAWLV